MTATEQLIERARDGDQAAWDELVEEYAPLLWRVARGLSLSPEEASDVVQSTWLRLVEALPTIDPPSDLASVLAIMVRREARRWAAHAQRDSAPNPQPSSPDPAAVVVQQERDALLARAMQQLPLRCQTLLLAMLDPSNPSYHRIAAALDMPVGSIGPTRARCLQRLRKLVETLGLQDNDVLATEDSLVRALRDTPRVLDTVPPEVVRNAARAQQPE